MSNLELAINGGLPVREKNWPTYEDGTGSFDDDVKEEVLEVLESGKLFRYDTRALADTKTGNFELKLAKYFNSRYALALSSGTAALTVSLLALNLPKGFEVACPAFGFPATASAVLLAGGKPKLFAVDKNLHFSLDDLSNRWSDKIKAIIVVHMRGFSSHIKKIVEFANKHNIPVVEDAIPALGARYGNKLLGTFGDVGCFSMQSDKTINTGEGGFLVTNNPKIYELAVLLSGAFEGRYRKHINKITSEYSLPLFNFRIDEIRSALAIKQLQKLDNHVCALQRNYKYIAEKIANIPNLRIREPVKENAYLGDSLVFFVPSGKADWVAEAITKEGVKSRCFGSRKNKNVRSFWNWHFISSWNDDFIDECPSYLTETAEILDSSVDIPLSPLLSNKDLDDSVAAIKKVMRYLD